MTEPKVDSEILKSTQDIEIKAVESDFIAPEAVLIHPEIEKYISFKRFVAKKVDLTICVYFVAMMVAIFDRPGVQGFGINVLIGVVTVMLLIPIEAFLISKFGTTIGKSLLNIKMTTKEKEKISFGVALKRSGLSSLKGMALGLPVVSLITNYIAYDHLSSNGTVSWDDECAIEVTYKKLGIVKLIIAIIVGVLIFGSNLLGSMLAASQT